MKDDNLDELSGEGFVKQKPRYILPIIRLNGKEGVFYKYITDSEGKVEKMEVGDTLKGTVLKVRRTFSAFTKDYRLYTNEHNSWRDKMILFESREGKTQMVDVGTSSELRPKYPELRMRQVLYFLLEPAKEVVKLLVKGKGLSNLFDFWNEFKVDEHIYQYLLEIKAQEEVGELGEFYSTTFARINEVEDMDLIAEKIKEIAGKITAVESFYGETKPEEIEKEIVDETEILAGQNKKKKAEEKEENIDVKDIPF